MSKPDEKTEQMFFDFVVPDSAETAQSNVDKDQMPLVFDSEDAALSTLLTKSSSSIGEEEWVPCDPADESDRIAEEWLSKENGNSISEELPPIHHEIASAIPSAPEESNNRRDDFSVSRPSLQRPKLRSPQALTRQRLIRASLGWLALQKPAALSAKVPTLLSRFYADAGAFWIVPNLRNTVKIARTALVQTCLDPEKCRKDLYQRQRLQEQLVLEKAKKMELERKIREEEPYLKDDSLFEETQTWDYSRSSNRAYRKCLKQIEKLEFSLSHDSIFERIRYEKLASEYYLAVPENLLSIDEAPEAWGLLYIMPDLTVKLVKAAFSEDCPEENSINWCLKIAASGTPDTLFTHGISEHSGKIVFRPLPKRRQVRPTT